jgi:hypothetical protein
MAARCSLRPRQRQDAQHEGREPAPKGLDAGPPCSHRTASRPSQPPRRTPRQWPCPRPGRGAAEGRQRTARGARQSVRVLRRHPLALSRYTWGPGRQTSSPSQRTLLRPPRAKPILPWPAAAARRPPPPALPAPHRPRAAPHLARHRRHAPAQRVVPLDRRLPGVHEGAVGAELRYVIPIKGAGGVEWGAAAARWAD